MIDIDNPAKRQAEAKCSGEGTLMILDFFKENYGIEKIGEIAWAHRVNTRARLEETLLDPTRR